MAPPPRRNERAPVRGFGDKNAGPSRDPRDRRYEDKGNPAGDDRRKKPARAAGIGVTTGSPASDRPDRLARTVRPQGRVAPAERLDPASAESTERTGPDRTERPARGPASERPPRGPASERPARGPASERGAERPQRGPSRGEEGRWFSINVGRSKNADPKWLIPLLCRRGNVTKKAIGKIQVLMRETRVEIAPDAADAFAVAIQRPDDKDRNIHIEPVDAS
jgi:hypothetical protein